MSPSPRKAISTKTSHRVDERCLHPQKTFVNSTMTGGVGRCFSVKQTFFSMFLFGFSEKKQEYKINVKRVASIIPSVFIARANFMDELFIQARETLMETRRCSHWIVTSAHKEKHFPNNSNSFVSGWCTQMVCLTVVFHYLLCRQLRSE